MRLRKDVRIIDYDEIPWRLQLGRSRETAESEFAKGGVLTVESLQLGRSRETAERAVLAQPTFSNISFN